MSAALREALAALLEGIDHRRAFHNLPRLRGEMQARAALAAPDEGPSGKDAEWAVCEECSQQVQLEQAHVVCVECAPAPASPEPRRARYFCNDPKCVPCCRLEAIHDAPQPAWDFAKGAPAASPEPELSLQSDPD